MEGPISRHHLNEPRMYDAYSIGSHYQNRQITPPSYPDIGSRSYAPRASDYYSQSQHYPLSRYPPSPPAEKFQKLSLPPISTLLEYSHDRNWESAPPQHTQYPTREVSQYPPRPSPIQSEIYNRRTSPYQTAARSRRESPQQPRSESADRNRSTAFDPHAPSPSSSSPGMSMQRPLPATFPPQQLSQSRLSPPMSAPLTGSAAWSSANAPRISNHSHHNSSSSQASSSMRSASLGSLNHPASTSLNSSSLPSPSSPSTAPTSATSQSSSAALPDRYICPSCSKAFSRPSSLRIHVHSHTGEKPFMCPHDGCGKAFSVRSNMKRHQRGCHISGGMSSSSATERMEIDESSRIMLPAMG